eukprot:SAG31_NODE_3384_length_4334_cov_5.140496_3_plen_177_part_00
MRINFCAFSAGAACRSWSATVATAIQYIFIYFDITAAPACAVQSAATTLKRCCLEGTNEKLQHIKQYAGTNGGIIVVTCFDCVDVQKIEQFVRLAFQFSNAANLSSSCGKAQTKQMHLQRVGSTAQAALVDPRIQDGFSEIVESVRTNSFTRAPCGCFLRLTGYLCLTLCRWLSRL